MISEQSKKRNQNRYDLLRTLQALGPMRRRELGDICAIRLSSITSLVDELFRAGILANQLEGRPRSPLVFTSDRWFVATLYVTADDLRVALVGLDGAASGESTLELGECSYGELFESMCSRLSGILGTAPGRLLGIGVALPGIVDSREGVWHYAAKLPQVRQARIRDELAERFGLPVYVENDVRCSLWAGIWFEQLLGQYQNAIYLSITSGINSALLINSDLHLGATFSAGEIGHLRAGTENRICRCGREDCLESYCSIPALARDLSALLPELGALSGAAGVAEAARQYPVAAEVLQRAMERICVVLSPLVAYVDPQVVLLGNQLPEFYDAVLPFLRHHLSSPRLQGSYGGSVPIEIVRSPSPALRGVAGLVLDQVFKGDIGDRIA